MQDNSVPHLIDCKPSTGFATCIHVAVFIKTLVEDVFDVVAPITNNPIFFPNWEFELLEDSAVHVGSVFRSRYKYQPTWATHRITALEPNARLAGEQVKGFFKNYRFSHRFIPVDGGTMSDEIWEYTLPYGALGAFLDRIYVKRKVTKTLCEGHARLKAYVETRHTKEG